MKINIEFCKKYIYIIILGYLTDFFFICRQKR